MAVRPSKPDVSSRLVPAREAIREMVSRSRDKELATHIFLTGAGVSVSSHIPDGHGVYDHLRRRGLLSPENLRRACRRWPNLSTYQAAMRFVEERHPRGRRWIAGFIRQMIRKARRADGRWVLNNTHDILAGILIHRPRFARMVMTTNFDPLMFYGSLQAWHTEPVVIRHYKELDTMEPDKLQNEFPVLLYLHGYWQNHEQYHQPEHLPGFIRGWGRGLGRFDDHDVIVLGYSGLEDSIAVRWLRQRLRGKRRVWWCVYCPGGSGAQPAQADLEAIEKRLGARPGDGLCFVPISGADDFVLGLGASLRLPRASQIRRAKQVFPWFSPSGLDKFSNQARLGCRVGGRLVLRFSMGGQREPGNNHAGLNIDTVLHQTDLSRHDNIEVHYRVRQLDSSLAQPRLELKLHSTEGAWSYHLPLVPGSRAHVVPLARYVENGVDLRKIWRIVVAVDVRGLGPRGSAEVVLEKTELKDTMAGSL